MRNTGFIWFLIALMLVLDWYVFQAVKVVTQSAAPKWRMLIFGLYWTLAGVSLLILLLMPYIQPDTWPKTVRNYLFANVVGFVFAQLLAAVFLLLDDIRRGGMWILSKLFSNPSVEISQAADGITRSQFMSWLGLAAGTTLFGTLLYGFRNKYRYQVEQVALQFSKLPAAFKGLKLVHISDIHAGSFTDKQAVVRGIQKIMAQQPDLIIFSGDLVNDRAAEMESYVEVFRQLKAPLGVYSTLGNHDYGDYVRWESPEAKAANLEQLKKVHASLGWRLLMNEHVVIEKEGAQLALLGIENWSAKGRFPKYGDMASAYAGAEHIPFKMLISHDPSHWEAEVLSKYPDIALMMSGHTHGMQFGLEIPGLKWSPVQYMYKQWAGLYEQADQKLYVNRGFGFIGYPGRVGILPEITVMTLT